jgi:excisionase family DNA binding protein
MSGKLLLSVEEAAQRLGIGRDKFYKMISSREITSVKVGRRRLIPARALEDFVERLMAEGDGSDAQ